jgi:tyrosyl-tRNA synthetase
MPKQTELYHEFLASLETRLISLHGDLTPLSAAEQLSLLKSRAAHIVKPDLLFERLQNSKANGQPLKVKYGVDPTGADLHLGHIVPVIVARRLLQMGHHVTILLGDFTAMVGDPTGRVKTRPSLTPEQISEHVSSYKDQIRKFIDIRKVDFVYNSSFYDEKTIASLFRLYGKVRLSPLLQRDDFRKRAEGLTVAEALYPTLMAIDSMHMLPDIELGGDDQLLNFNIANDFLSADGLPLQSALTTPLLLGTSGNGRKMSKSENNYISLREDPANAYGKVMSIPDSQLEHYFKLLTDIDNEELEELREGMEAGINPIHVKKLLARIIVSLLHDEETAREEQGKFEHVFSQRGLPEEIPEFRVELEARELTPVNILTAVQFARSKSEARRLIQSGAVRWVVGDVTLKVTDPDQSLPNLETWIVNVGKRQFARIILGSASGVK